MERGKADGAGRSFDRLRMSGSLDGRRMSGSIDGVRMSG